MERSEDFERQEELPKPKQLKELSELNKPELHKAEELNLLLDLVEEQYIVNVE